MAPLYYLHSCLYFFSFSFSIFPSSFYKIYSLRNPIIFIISIIANELRKIIRISPWIFKIFFELYFSLKEKIKILSYAWTFIERKYNFLPYIGYFFPWRKFWRAITWRSLFSKVEHKNIHNVVNKKSLNTPRCWQN